jgi:hypothetical protein
MLTEKELNLLCVLIKEALIYGYDKGRDEVHAHERRNIEQFKITPARRLTILTRLTKARRR